MTHQEATDNTMPNGKWAFDANVTEVFDNMLARSIPQYQTMRDLVTHFAAEYAKPNTDIVDLGCSRGEALAPLIYKFGAWNRFTGVEISKPMLEVCRERFAGMIRANIVNIREMDLRHEYPPVRASVTLAVLTLQFVPIEYRHNLLAKIYEHTLPGGALIVVEKILGGTAKYDALFVDRYREMKKENGYSTEQIDRKKAALEGVLVPITAAWNEELLRMAGFTEVECFWRWCNFAGWIATK